LRLHDGCKWTIWENIDVVDSKAKMDWNSTIRKVAWFDNMI